MTTNRDVEPAVYRENSLHDVNRSNPTVADETLEFGPFRLLLRQRQLLADGMPVELGTRAFDLLLVLLETDGSLVTKDELMSRVWPGIVVAEENLKVQIFALRKALGEDRELIRTEFGRGYRLTATVRSTVARSGCRHPTRRRHQSSRRFIPQWTSPAVAARLCARRHPARRIDPAHGERAASCRG